MTSAATETTRHWLLKSPPIGAEADLFSLFELSEQPLPDTKSPDKVLVKTKYISNDPTQRGWMRSDNTRSYMKPVQPGEPMRAWAVGEVLSSTSENFSVGDQVFGFLNWTSLNVFDNPGTTWPRGLMKLPPGVHPADYLALSVTALTAHVGLFQCGQPKPTDRILVVSGAAGATGSTVVQIAKKVLGLERVIGIAGGADKCKIVKEIGANYALDYKSPTFQEDFKAALGDNTIDIYFDNVGGTILDLCLRNMSKYGRVIACGAISTYKAIVANTDTGGVSAVGWVNIVTHSLSVKGFIMSDYNDKIGEASKDLYNWFGEGKLRPLKTVWKAKFEEVPRGLMMLFAGENVGKLVTELVD